MTSILIGIYLIVIALACSKTFNRLSLIYEGNIVEETIFIGKGLPKNKNTTVYFKKFWLTVKKKVTKFKCSDSFKVT